MADAPEIAVYLALDGSTWLTEDASITWTDVTDYVVDIPLSTNRGRSSEFDDYRAGTCSFRLDNSDRRFDPSYTSGPYYGFLVPGIPVKVTGTPSGGSERQVYRGFLQGIPQDYNPADPFGASCHITAVDAFGKLAGTLLPSSVYAVEVAADSPHGWWRLSESTGSEMGDTSGNGYAGTYRDGTAVLSGKHPNQWETIDALELDGAHWGTVDDEQARIEVEPLAVDCIVQFDAETGTTSQQDIIRQGAGHDTEHFTMGISSGGVFFGRSAISGAASESIIHTAGTNMRDGLPHHLAYRRTSTQHRLYIDGENVTETVLGSYTQVNFGVNVGGSDATDGSNNMIAVRGRLADVAIYAGLSPTRITDHYNALANPWGDDTSGARVTHLADAISFPSDLRDVATGYTRMAPAVLGDTALPLLKKCEAAEQGRLFISRDGKLTFRDRTYHQTSTEGSTVQVTFDDDGTDIGYESMGFDFDARLLFKKVRGSRRGGAEIVVEDPAATGDQTDSDLMGLDVLTDAQIRTLCEARLARYKEPAMRPRPITFDLAGLTTSQQDDVLQLDLGHRVSVTRRPQGVGSAITTEALVESIEFRVLGNSWYVTLTLSPVDLVEYGIVGTSEVGTTFIVGP